MGSEMCIRDRYNAYDVPADLLRKMSEAMSEIGRKVRVIGDLNDNKMERKAELLTDPQDMMTWISFSLVWAIYLVWLAPQPPCHVPCLRVGLIHTEVQATQLRMTISGRAPPFDLSLVGLSLAGESEQAWSTRQFPSRVSRA